MTPARIRIMAITRVSLRMISPPYKIPFAREVGKGKEDFSTGDGWRGVCS
jgi:hypothetical protein